MNCYTPPGRSRIKRCVSVVYLKRKTGLFQALCQGEANKTCANYNNGFGCSGSHGISGQACNTGAYKALRSETSLTRACRYLSAYGGLETVVTDYMIQ
jgi:hypothetical protein